jgi:hypothetical protein
LSGSEQAFLMAGMNTTFGTVNDDVLALKDTSFQRVDW